MKTQIAFVMNTIVVACGDSHERSSNVSISTTSVRAFDVSCVARVRSTYNIRIVADPMMMMMMMPTNADKCVPRVVDRGFAYNPPLIFTQFLFDLREQRINPQHYATATAWV